MLFGLEPIDIEIFPLNFEKALKYSTEQLHDGNSLALSLLKHINFKEGHFFSLLHPSADKNKIYEFRTGWILPPNPLEPVIFRGKVYPGRKRANSVPQLAMYLKQALHPGQSCFFEDVVLSKSDPMKPELQMQALYFLDEVYFFITQETFTMEIAERIIHWANGQWYYMNVISEEEPGFNRELTEEKLQNIAVKTTHIVLGAYDIEGYVIWTRTV